jgi:hypothetical protein
LAEPDPPRPPGSLASSSLEPLASWSELLDEVELRLKAHELALSHQGKPPKVFPPLDELDLERLGPLPKELEARAKELLSRTWAITGRVREAMGTLVELSRHTHTTQLASSKPPVFLDERA